MSLVVVVPPPITSLVCSVPPLVVTLCDVWNEEIKHVYVSLWKIIPGTVVKLQISNKDAAMNFRQVLARFTCFRNGYLSLEYQPRSRQTSIPTKIRKINKPILKDCSQTLNNIFDDGWCALELNFELGISNENRCIKSCSTFSHGRLETVTTKCVSWTVTHWPCSL